MEQATIRSYVDKAEAVATLRRCLSNLVATVRAVRAPEASAIGTWSSRDVAVHLGNAFRIRRDILAGKPVPLERIEQTAEVNQRLIESVSERDMNRLADRIEGEAIPLIEQLEGLDEDAIVPWAEVQVPVTALISADIAECLVHGYDIARAEGRPFEIDPHDAALAVRGLSPLTRHYVDPVTAKDLEAVFRLHLRGQGAMDFIFDHGTLDIEEASARTADVYISADPVSFLLTGYGRLPLWKPLLKGRMISWGRKPWLALRFPKLLKNP